MMAVSEQVPLLQEGKIYVPPSPDMTRLNIHISHRIQAINKTIPSLENRYGNKTHVSQVPAIEDVPDVEADPEAVKERAIPSAVLPFDTAETSAGSPRGLLKEVSASLTSRVSRVS